MRDATSVSVDLPILQARQTRRFIAFRTTRGTLDAFPLIGISVMVCRAVTHATAIVPELSFAAGYALGAVSSLASLASRMTQTTAEGKKYTFCIFLRKA